MSRMRTVLVLLIVALGLAGHDSAGAPPRQLAITNVRIFDGNKVIQRGTVVVRGVTIKAVGRNAKVPRSAEVIDGSGATLLPGFIDSHTHPQGRIDTLQRAAAFGVTTEIDMFSDPAFGRAMREEQAAGGAFGRADVFSAGYLATAPNGHGTQYAVQVPTLNRPDEAQGWVDARLAEGSDFIKIVSEDGSAYGRQTPTLSRATLGALVQAAHRRGRLAVAHIGTQERAYQAIEEGVDGLVHIFTNVAPEPAFSELVAERKAFVVPTLTVVESTTGIASGRSLTEDPRLVPFLRSDEVANLRQSFAFQPALDFRHALDAVRDLRLAGVPILAGSDAPNPGTAHGVSLHRELELLVAAGLSPLEALRAATSVPAAAFGLKDRGRIARGLRADLVLVEGDPTEDVTATRAILKVWKLGQEVERPTF